MKNSDNVRLLCYDEPSASLDPKAEFGWSSICCVPSPLTPTTEMFERLRKLRGEKTMIFVTQ